MQQAHQAGDTRRCTVTWNPTAAVLPKGQTSSSLSRLYQTCSVKLLVCLRSCCVVEWMWEIMNEWLFWCIHDMEWQKLEGLVAQVRRVRCFVPFCRQMVSLQGASFPYISPPFLHCKTSLWVLCWCSSLFTQIRERNVKKRRPICPSQPLARHAVSSPPSFSTLQVRTAEQPVSFSPADPQNTNSFLSVRFPCTCTKPKELAIHFP